MSWFRFKLRRVEIRDGEIDVEADTFTAAALIAADVEDHKIPRKARMRTTFAEDPDPSVTFEIISGREVS